MLCCVQSVRAAAGTSLAASQACVKALRDRCAQQDAAALLVSCDGPVFASPLVPWSAHLRSRILRIMLMHEEDDAHHEQCAH